ncbi:MAG: ribokinase [Terracoccus sp.]
MSTIGVVGSLNVDLSYRVTPLPVPGETVLARDRAMSFGGKGGNQAVAAAALGGDVCFIGAVGTDEAGQAYLEHLRVAGVDVGGVAQHAEVDTGTAMIFVDDAGENLIVVDPGANSLLDAAWVEPHVRRRTLSVVLLQLEVPLTALEAAAAALPDGTVLVLNPAPMPPDAGGLRRLLDRVDVLVPNRTELGQLVGRSEPRTMLEVRECLSALDFAGAVIVTLGADGAILVEPGTEPVHRPALRLEPVDTTGAGDAFCGALAFGLSEGHPLADAVARAVQVAGESTLFRGAQLSVPLTISRSGGGAS